MPDHPSNRPFLQEVEPRSYSWCSCGQSKNQPFCDGSHGPTGLFPKVVRFTEKTNVAWCMCKATSNPPFCDGSHKDITA